MHHISTALWFCCLSHLWKSWSRFSNRFTDSVTNVFAAGADKFGVQFDEFEKRLLDSNLQIDSFGFGCGWVEERRDESPFWGLEDCSLGASQRRRQNLHEEML